MGSIRRTRHRRQGQCTKLGVGPPPAPGMRAGPSGRLGRHVGILPDPPGSEIQAFARIRAKRSRTGWAGVQGVRRVGRGRRVRRGGRGQQSQRARRALSSPRPAGGSSSWNARHPRRPDRRADPARLPPRCLLGHPPAQVGLPRPWRPGPGRSASSGAARRPARPRSVRPLVLQERSLAAPRSAGVDGRPWERLFGPSVGSGLT